MRARLKFAAWLAGVYGSVLATAAGVVVLVGAGMPAETRQVLYRLLAAKAPMLSFIAVLLLAACGGIVAWMFKRYVTAPHALAEQTRVAWRPMRATAWTRRALPSERPSLKEALRQGRRLQRRLALDYDL